MTPYKNGIKIKERGSSKVKVLCVVTTSVMEFTVFKGR